MSVIKIEVELPEEIFLLLRRSKRDIGEDIRKAIALQLFQEHLISSGKAAELAGMCLSDFMDLTREKRIPWFDYTEEEVEKEIEEARKLAGQLKIERDKRSDSSL